MQDGNAEEELGTEEPEDSPDFLNKIISWKRIPYPLTEDLQVRSVPYLQGVARPRLLVPERDPPVCSNGYPWSEIDPVTSEWYLQSECQIVTPTGIQCHFLCREWNDFVD